MRFHLKPPSGLSLVHRLEEPTRSKDSLNRSRASGGQIRKMAALLHAAGRTTATVASADERLVARAQAGDQAAFDELAGRYETRLRRILFRITRDCDAAYDAVQEALMRAWSSIGRFEGRSQFFTWLTRIGINEAYRTARRPAEDSLDADDQVGQRIADWGNQPDEVFESHEFLSAVEGALAELPLDYRRAVTLRDVEGLSTTEAAEALGISERALKSRLHRGRMALRAKLDHYFEDGYA
jgi:RNA polymerase sigma-70 factor (ECF subfamily)